MIRSVALYESGSHDPWFNLAVEQYLLESVEDQCILYLWQNENTVVIGRNQNPWKECRTTLLEQEGGHLARRLSGGGAVFHDLGNLNFTLLMPQPDFDLERQLSVICQAVRGFGIPAEKSGRNDILAGGRKFSGNAFCQRKEMCQHHGTLLIRSDMGRLQRYLQVDPRKIKAKGIESVRSRVCNLSELSHALTTETMLAAIRTACSETYGEPEQFRPSPEQLAQVLPYLEKQKSWQWRLGRTPSFDLELDTRFSWGGVQLLLTLKEGLVAEVKVYTDAIDPDLPEELEQRLTGVRFGSRPMHDALAMSQQEHIRDVGEFLLEEGI